MTIDTMIPKSDETTADMLRDSGETYRAVFHSVNDAIIIHDLDTGAILDVNEKMTRMFGCSADEARGITIGDISSGEPPYDQEGAVEKIRAAAEKGGLLFEWRFRHRSGRLFWAEVNLKPSLISGRTLVVSVIRDITERKQAEGEREGLIRQLGDERRKLETILEQLPSGVSIAEAPSGRLLYHNTMAEKLIRHPMLESEDDRGYTRYGALHADGTPYDPEEYPIARALFGEHVSLEEMLYRRGDGTLTHLTVSAAPVRDREGSIIAAVSTFDDISDRKRAEAALRESEEEYRSLFESSIDGILLTTPDGGIHSANPAACRILGRTEMEIVQAGREGTLDTSDPRLEPFLEERRRTGSARGELSYRRKDGTLFPVDVSSSIIKDRNGQPEASVIFRDITERKKAEEKIRLLNEELEEKVHDRTVALAGTVANLEEQREILQTIIDHIPVMLTLYGPDGGMRLVNREFEKLVGWSLEEVRNMDLLAAVYPDPDYRREVWEFMREARPGWRDFEITTRSGDILQTSWANVRLSDGSQIGIGIDVGERKKMEQDLLRLAAAVDQTSEGIILTTPEGVTVYMNSAYERLTGYGRDEMTGKRLASFREYLAGNDLQKIFDRVIREGSTWSGRQIRKRKTGELIHVNLSVSPVHDQAGRIVFFVQVIQDITREVMWQRQLAETQKMEAIGSLAGGIAHDLKNVLTPILINVEIALEDMEKGHPARPVLEETLHAARLGRDLVGQILTFSRRSPRAKAPVNVSAVIRETLGFMRSTLPPTVGIRGEIEDDCVVACADSTQIKQVLINLGSNAGHAMKEEGGTLDVAESRLVLDEEGAARISSDLAPGPYIRVTVHDTGHGMDEKTMEHIFEPFFTTKKGEGTGMGLAVVHGIIKEHHGAITVRSRPEQGSTFTVLLPELQGDQAENLCRHLKEKEKGG